MSSTIRRKYKFSFESLCFRGGAGTPPYHQLSVEICGFIVLAAHEHEHSEVQVFK